MTSLISGCGRLVFVDLSLVAFAGAASFSSEVESLKEGVSGSLRISLLNRYHPAALSSVLYSFRKRSKLLGV